MNRARFFLAVIPTSALLLSAGCTNRGAADQTALVERLAARVQHLEDMQAIQKLQSKYTHYLLTHNFDKIVEEVMAKQTADVSVEFSDSGVYRGQDSVRALYEAFEETKRIPGFFIMHVTVNPYIEIAADGLSARSHWLSPGATGSNTSARWVWGHYYVEYVKEDDQWRILHSNLVPIFRNAYDVSWAEADEHGTVRTLSVEPDEPPSLYVPFDERKRQTNMFRDHPPLPEPY